MYMYIRMEFGVRACGVGTKLGSGSPTVTMMQPSQALMRADATRGHGATSAAGCSLPESEIRAVLVVVAEVRRKQPLQMAFIDCNDVIQQVTAATADPALREAILPRTFE